MLEGVKLHLFSKAEIGLGVLYSLVAQCSAIGVSVAATATPPCSAIRFCKQISRRHSDRGVAR